MSSTAPPLGLLETIELRDGSRQREIGRTRTEKDREEQDYSATDGHGRTSLMARVRSTSSTRARPVSRISASKAARAGTGTVALSDAREAVSIMLGNIRYRERGRWLHSTRLRHGERGCDLRWQSGWNIAGRLPCEQCLAEFQQPGIEIGAAGEDGGGSASWTAESCQSRSPPSSRSTASARMSISPVSPAMGAPKRHETASCRRGWFPRRRG